MHWHGDMTSNGSFEWNWMKICFDGPPQSQPIKETCWCDCAGRSAFSMSATVHRPVVGDPNGGQTRLTLTWVVLFRRRFFLFFFPSSYLPLNNENLCGGAARQQTGTLAVLMMASDMGVYVWAGLSLSVRWVLLIGLDPARDSSKQPWEMRAGIHHTQKKTK